MILDFKLPFLRVLFLLSHFVLTCFLYWTKFSSLQVTMLSNYRDDHHYKIINQQYTGLMSFGLIVLIIEALIVCCSEEAITFGSTMHLFLDMVACFFISWIVLDGLDWQTYVYIFFFCMYVVIYNIISMSKNTKFYSSFSTKLIHVPFSFFIILSLTPTLFLRRYFTLRPFSLCIYLRRDFDNNNNNNNK